jgi:hypothetical protein
MMRLATITALVTMFLLAYGVYHGGALARAEEAKLRRIERTIAQEHAKIKILNADWALLTKPERLQELAARHLALAPVAAAQFTQLASLPMRGQAATPGLTLQDVPKRKAPAAANPH